MAGERDEKNIEINDMYCHFIICCCRAFLL